MRETFEGHRALVSDLEFSLDGRLLVSGSRDKTARVWDVGSALGNPPSNLTTSGDGVAEPLVLATEIDVNGDATYLPNEPNCQTGDGSGDHLDVDHDNSQSLSNATFLNSGINCIAVSPDGRYVAAGSSDNLIRLWDLPRTSSSAGERQPPVLVSERLKGHRNSVESLSFANNGRFLVSASWDKDVRVWDVTHLGIAPAPEPLSSPSSSPREPGIMKLAKGNDRPVMGRKGKQKSHCTMRLVGNWDRVFTIAVNPDGRWVVSGSADGGVMWWDLGLSSGKIRRHRRGKPRQ
jgi:glucose repression regulatory protein TUP1